MNKSLIKSFNAAITVCDSNCIILEMNGNGFDSYKEDNGRKLLGTNPRQYYIPSSWYENYICNGFSKLNLPILSETANFT